MNSGLNPYSPHVFSTISWEIFEIVQISITSTARKTIKYPPAYLNKRLYTKPPTLPVLLSSSVFCVLSEKD